MELAIHPVVQDEQGEFWALYERAFADLRVGAAQRHVMLHQEFEELLADSRVIKYVVRDPARGRLSGLATMTNDLDAVPLVSPEYFQLHYPESVAAGNLWYVNFVAVDPDYHGTGTFGMIIGEACRRVAPVGGVICLDVSERSELQHQLPSAIERIGNTFAPGTSKRRLDSQVYWAYQFPGPA